MQGTIYCIVWTSSEKAWSNTVEKKSKYPVLGDVSDYR